VPRNPTFLDAVKEALPSSAKRPNGLNKPEDFVDMSVIKEFDDSGFIDRLYRKR
jgi:hypothetical protein